MEDNEVIVKQFSKYCSKCNGLCCKRGVFTIFDWEVQKLSKEFVNFHHCKVSDVRGKAQDVAINELCKFSKENGCKLPMELRPTDCLTYPFYPKLKENKGEWKIEYFVIDKECTYNNEIAKDKILIDSVKNFWDSMLGKVTSQEITDWIGANGCWHDWYKKAIRVEETLNIVIK